MRSWGRLIAEGLRWGWSPEKARQKAVQAVQRRIRDRIANEKYLKWWFGDENLDIKFESDGQLKEEIAIFASGGTPERRPL